MKRYMKKWWIEHTFEDGKIFRGWLNTTADKKEDFPEVLHGTFCAWRDEIGFHGHFVLDGQTEQEAIEKFQYVCSAGVLPKPVPIGTYNAQSREGAEAIWINNQVIDGYQFPRFDARIEDCLKLESTYIDSYEVKGEKKMAKASFEKAKEAWEEFGDVPMNPETECIEEEWNSFPAGTHREEIWHWFEESFDCKVADLMYGTEPSKDSKAKNDTERDV